MENNDPVFARPASYPLGPRSSELRAQVPDPISDEVRALAVMEGKTVSEWLCDLICTSLRGQVAMMRAARGSRNSGYTAGNSD